MHNIVVTDPKILEGKPFLEGTELPVSEVFKCLLDGLSLADVSKIHNVDRDTLNKVFEDLIDLANYED
jgi:uncharacterized protein (DUF433 family)